MKFVIQRVDEAKVMIADQFKSGIGFGLLIYMAIHNNDEVDICDYWINKILKLRIFSDDTKPINRSIEDVDGEILLISQFTLYGKTSEGNRPSFSEAKQPAKARIIYDVFEKKLREKWPKTQSGEFAADMKIFSINDGPVTIILE